MVERYIFNARNVDHTALAPFLAKKSVGGSMYFAASSVESAAATAPKKAITQKMIPSIWQGLIMLGFHWVDGLVFLKKHPFPHVAGNISPWWVDGAARCAFDVVRQQPINALPEAGGVRKEAVISVATPDRGSIV